MELFSKSSLVTLVIVIAGLFVSSSCGGPNTVVGKTFVQQEPHKNGKYSIMTYTKTGSIESVDVFPNGRKEKSTFDYVMVDNDLKISGFGGLVTRNFKITWINSNKMDVLLDDGTTETYAVKGSSEDNITNTIFGKTFVEQDFENVFMENYAVYSFEKDGGLTVNIYIKTDKKNSTTFNCIDNDNDVTMTSKDGSIDKFRAVWINKNKVQFQFSGGGYINLAVKDTPDDIRSTMKY